MRNPINGIGSMVLVSWVFIWYWSLDDRVATCFAPGRRNAWIDLISDRLGNPWLLSNDHELDVVPQLRLTHYSWTLPNCGLARRIPVWRPSALHRFIRWGVCFLSFFARLATFWRRVGVVMWRYFVISSILAQFKDFLLFLIQPTACWRFW